MSGQTESSHSVVILGRELRLRSDESPEYLDGLAEYIETCATELNRGKLPQLDIQILLATALQLADEVHKLRREQRDLVDKLRSSSRSLLARMSPLPGDRDDTGRALLQSDSARSEGAPGEPSLPFPSP